MRRRLRPAYSAEELAALYRTPHAHRRWPDHVVRVNVTGQIARYMYHGGTVADLSCGDSRCAALIGTDRLILGDFAPGYAIHGPIEETIDWIPHVELFLCCETLEHLDDPDAVLAKIRSKADALVLSTPEGEQTDENPEHYWGWDSDDVEGMLRQAGFSVAIHTIVAPREWHSAYQIWGCR